MKMLYTVIIIAGLAGFFTTNILLADGPGRERTFVPDTGPNEMDYIPITLSDYTGERDYKIKDNEIFATANGLITRRVEKNKLTIGRDAVNLAITIPADASINVSEGKITFTEDGLKWTYESLPLGVKSTAVVAASRGPKTYCTELSEPLHFKDGSVAGDTFIVQRALIIGDDGSTYSPSYSIIGSSFCFYWDDTSLPEGVYPYLIDPEVTFAIDESQADAQPYSADLAYPPTGGYGSGLQSSTTTCNAMKKFAGHYTVTNCILSWDTTSLPEGIRINSASLNVYLSTINDANARNLNVAWLDRCPPFLFSDFQSDVETNTLVAEVDISTFSVAAYNEIDLDITDHTIDTADCTTVRLTISGSAPAGNNEVAVSAFDGGSNFPQILIDYTESAELHTIVMGSVFMYENYVSTGDILVVAAHDIQYNALPDPTASDEYVFSFLEGSIYHQTTTPRVVSANSLKGYGEGITCFYFDPDQVTEQSLVYGEGDLYNVTGESTRFSRSVTGSQTSIGFLDTKLELVDQLAAMAQSLEAAWSLDLYENGRLTPDGQSYFTDICPNIEQELPELMFISVNPFEQGEFTQAITGSGGLTDGTFIQTARVSFASVVPVLDEDTAGDLLGIMLLLTALLIMGMNNPKLAFGGMYIICVGAGLLYSADFISAAIPGLIIIISAVGAPLIWFNFRNA